MSDIVNKFIYVFKSLIENIKLLCPKNSIINNNAKLIDSFVNSNKDLIIRIYCAWFFNYFFLQIYHICSFQFYIFLN